eukprot:s3438_g3.t1
MGYVSQRYGVYPKTGTQRPRERNHLVRADLWLKSIGCTGNIPMIWGVVLGCSIIKQGNINSGCMWHYLVDIDCCIKTRNSRGLMA